MTVQEALKSASALITLRDAELLLGHELDCGRAWLMAHPLDELDPVVASAFQTDVKRRKSGEPLQYITGVQEFFRLSFHVTPAVLIPRAETEHLVEAVLEWAGKQNASLRIADVGTGSGAISLALAANLSNAELWAIDISAAALKVAQENAVRLGLSDRVQFIEGDLLAGTKPGLDVVVSNPPYIPLGDAATMQREVVGHEPHAALFAGDDGLEIYRKLIPQAQTHLRAGGLLAMEIGFGQKEALEDLLQSWRNVRFIQDYADIPRVVVCEKA